jgi:hypothetical protein
MSARAPHGLPACSTAARHLGLLACAFAVFNAARIAAYLPTIWAIYTSGDSNQHSWFTWFTWAGANATMAAWLFEQSDRKMTCAIAVNLCNAFLCTATLAIILVYRT